MNNNIRNHLSEKESFFKDGIQYSIEMADISYNRLKNTLYQCSELTTNNNLDKIVVLAIIDAWSIIDSIYRCRRLLEDAPNMKQNSMELQLFYRRTNDVKDLRDIIQHLDSDVYSNIANRLPIWGTINWVIPSKENRNLIHIYSIVPGHLFQRATPLINPAGKTIRDSIDLITLESKKTVCLSELIDNLHQLVRWLNNSYMNLENPSQATFTKAEFEF